MNIHTFQRTTTSTVGLIVALLFMPLVSLASGEPIVCALTATTELGTVKLQHKQSVQMLKGDVLTIVWKSENATKAYDIYNDKITLDGSATSSPTKSTKLKYTFTDGSKKATCETTVVVVAGSITMTPVLSVPTKPKLAGTASGLKTVQVQIVKDGGLKPLYTSNVLRVKNGVWNTKINRTLKKGKYTVLLLGGKKTALNTIATSSLVIGAPAKAVTKSSTTFVVEPLALLIGGTVKAGASVPISYLQVVNIGKTVGVVTGFTVKQNGSASVQSIVGFTVSDDQSSLVTSIAPTVNSPLFVNNHAMIPVNMLIPSGQMRLFTIKAIIDSSVHTAIGKQLKLDITSVTTNATVQSKFPIRGTTWTVGY